MLIFVGGLDAIQTFVILVASPFMLLMAAMAAAFYADLRKDPLRQELTPQVRQHAPDPMEAEGFDTSTGTTSSYSEEPSESATKRRLYGEP